MPDSIDPHDLIALFDREQDPIRGAALSVMKLPDWLSDILRLRRQGAAQRKLFKRVDFVDEAVVPFHSLGFRVVVTYPQKGRLRVRYCRRRHSNPESHACASAHRTPHVR